MQPLIAANWKMHKTLSEVIDYFSRFEKYNSPTMSPIFFLPAIYLPTAKSLTQFHLGVQNIHHEEKGAFTGETSLQMVKDFCSWVLVGHSDRRIYTKETDAEVNKKIKLARKYNKKVMLCVGETALERNEKQTQQVLKQRLIAALDNIHDIANIAITYEPYWAISNGNPAHKPATPEDAEQAHQWIRAILTEKYTQEAAEQCPILYGGSVKKENAAIFHKQTNINGLLVGNASLDPDEFGEIVIANVTKEKINKKENCGFTVSLQ